MAFSFISDSLNLGVQSKMDAEINAKAFSQRIAVFVICCSVDSFLLDSANSYIDISLGILTCSVFT